MNKLSSLNISCSCGFHTEIISFFLFPVSFVFLPSVTFKCFDLSNTLPAYLIIFKFLLFLCEINMSKEFNLYCEDVSIYFENGY